MGCIWCVDSDGLVLLLVALPGVPNPYDGTRVTLRGDNYVSFYIRSGGSHRTWNISVLNKH